MYTKLHIQVTNLLTSIKILETNKNYIYSVIYKRLIMHKYFRMVVCSFTVLLALLSACKEETTIKNDIPPVNTDTLTLNGKIGNEAGQNAGNSVFVDLSRIDPPVVVPRESWDLGFYCGEEFRVILNHSTASTALQRNETDLKNFVLSEADSIAINTDKTLEFGTSLNNVDAVAGDLPTYLSGTVIKEVSATNEDNKVYVINRGLARDGVTKRGWEKFRVTRISNGYAVQFDKITENIVPRAFTVIKDPAYNFKFISFTGNTVNVEPRKGLWDFEWTYSTYKTTTGTASAEHDFVLINFTAGVQAAQLILTGTGANTTITYEGFTEANLEGVTFLGTRDVIGTNWRTIASSNGTTQVSTGRYYLIKDPQGNIYKLRFLPSVTGNAVFEYKLVKPYRVFSTGT
jgi:hypothetical protein